MHSNHSHLVATLPAAAHCTLGHGPLSKIDQNYNNFIINYIISMDYNQVGSNKFPRPVKRV